MRVHKYVIRVFYPGSGSDSVAVTYIWFTGEATGQNTHTFTGYSKSSDGYALLEFVPTDQIVLGASIGVSMIGTMEIVSLVGYYSDGGPALTINQNAT